MNNKIKINYIRHTITLIISLLISGNIFSQIGGRNTYSFLNFLPSARLAAAAGSNVAVKDYDASLAFQNPSLLNDEMLGQLSLNYVNYISDVNYGVVGYVLPMKKKDIIFASSLTYLNYGKFVQTDATSAITGNFSASDYCLSFGAGKNINKVLSVGSNFKLIYSALETYKSFGLALDFSGHYQHPSNLFSATLLARNVGLQLKSYTSNSKENLPIQTQAAIAYKPEHVPLRILIMYDNLHKWKIFQQDTTVTFDPITGQEIVPKSSFGKNLAQHFSFGTEILLSKYFNVRIGYQVRRQQELRIESKAGLIGFNGGIGFKVSKFVFSYAFGKYHFFGNSHHLSIAFKPSDFYKKS